MTMKYAHVGIVDQAKAVAKLPAPGNGALHGRGISGGVRCHSPSSGGKVDQPEKSENPCGDRGFSIKRRHLANGGKMEAAGIRHSTRNAFSRRDFGNRGFPCGTPVAYIVAPLVAPLFPLQTPDF